MEKGSRRTAPSATARVKVQSPSLWQSPASAPARGLRPQRGSQPGHSPLASPAALGWGAAEGHTGSGTGRHLRNPVDSSILVIVRCRGENPHRGGWRRPGCPKPPPAPRAAPPWGLGLCSPPVLRRAPPTCREVRVLLEVGYDEVAEDVEAGEEQGTDLRAQERGQHGQEGSTPTWVMPPAPAPISSTLFIFPLLALVTPHACARPCLCPGAHPPVPLAPETAGRAPLPAALGQPVLIPGDPPATPVPAALFPLAPVLGRAAGTTLSQASRPAVVSLPPPPERQGLAGAGDVRGTQ